MLKICPPAVAAVALALCVTACGSSHKTTSSASGVESKTATTAATPARLTVKPDPEVGREAAEGRRNGFLKDYDTDIDDGGPHNYRDGDDRLIFAHYGQRATPAEKRAVTKTVNRYFALAAAGDGGKACQMLLPSVKHVVPLDYGRYGAWSVVHTAKTCSAVLTRLFAHYRQKLAVPVVVTGVLTKGNRAYALLGSRRFRAGFISLQTLDGKWYIGGVLIGAII